MIIQYYIHREILQKLLWVLGLLILIIASNRFAGFLEDAAEGNLPANMVFLILSYKMLATLPKILPISILVGMLLAFSRLASDKELVILAAAGISKAFQIAVVLRFAAVFCLFASVITLYAAPWAEQEIHNLKELAKKESDIDEFKTGQFTESKQSDRVIYVQRPSLDNLSMEEVFLQVRQEEGKFGVLTSASAWIEPNKKFGNKYIVFRDGQRYVGEPGLLDYQITGYEKYAILMESATASSDSTKMAALPTTAIIGSRNQSYQAEFQWRVSLILSCLLVSLLAVLLLQSHANESRYMPFVIGITIYLIYSNLLGIAKTLLSRAVIPGFVGLWWVHLLLVLVLLVFYYLPKYQYLKNSNNKHKPLPAD